MNFLIDLVSSNWYIFIVFFIIMPLDGAICVKFSWPLGLILICMHIPWFFTTILPKISN